MAIRGVLDALYGQVTFDDGLAALVSTPIVQRLRHVRLSNIDSLNMPGISNLSRFEHALGVAHLAANLGVSKKLAKFEHDAICAAALLHDWAITAFGHLVEEAYQFAGSKFDHEKQLRKILAGEAEEEIGSVNRQILHGRETKLSDWAKKVVGKSDADAFLEKIIDYASGDGLYGKIISSDIDIDNVDNIYRIAHHAGLPCDKGVPLRLAQGIVDVDRANGEPIFQKNVERDIVSWVSTRTNVYSHLMPAEYDFAGKLMMLSAAVAAVKSGQFRATDWSKTDYQFISDLLGSEVKLVSETVQRWLTGELWDISPLYWFEGKRPDFPTFLAFSGELEAQLGQPFFSYGIKDKRNRLLSVRFDDGSQKAFGEPSTKWLFGVGSPQRLRFGQKEYQQIITMAEDRFSSMFVGRHRLADIEEGDEDQLCLL